MKPLRALDTFYAPLKKCEILLILSKHVLFENMIPSSIVQVLKKGIEDTFLENSIPEDVVESNSRICHDYG